MYPRLTRLASDCSAIIHSTGSVDYDCVPFLNVTRHHHRDTSFHDDVSVGRAISSWQNRLSRGNLYPDLGGDRALQNKCRKDRIKGCLYGV